MALRARGINYDTGFYPGGHGSRERFDPDTVRHEMHVIAHDLHCTAVRVSGGDPERLSVAAELAVAEDLEVWFAPFPCEMTVEQLRPFFAECADRAEAVRVRSNAPVVLVLGCELSLFGAGFLPGETVFERIEEMLAAAPTGLHTVNAALNTFLGDVVADARTRFGGRITYASGTWEFIDWAPFDIVAVDAYRDRTNASSYAADLRRRIKQQDLPFVVTEFGCCTYAGAGDRGGIGWDIVDDSATPARLTGDFVRDEAGQATYLTECLRTFDEVGVDSAFWFTFASYGLPHRADPRLDLDMAAYGVVKMLDETAWEPKDSFRALAEAYRSER
jgi:hypothetical protein